MGRLKALAEKRKLENGTITPLLSISTEEVLGHIQKILHQVKGSKVLFGGEKLETSENVPKHYGLVKPTAVFVPI